MGIVWPVDGVYKRVVGVADDTPDRRSGVAPAGSSSFSVITCADCRSRPGSGLYFIVVNEMFQSPAHPCPLDLSLDL